MSAAGSRTETPFQSYAPSSSRAAEETERDGVKSGRMPRRSSAAAVAGPMAPTRAAPKAPGVFALNVQPLEHGLDGVDAGEDDPADTLIPAAPNGLVQRS